MAMKRVVKRSLDVALSIIGVIGLLPVMLSIALLISLDSPGGIFYRQRRVGMRFKIFSMYKFRTMALGAEKGGMITVRGDARITRMGRILRKYKLDEIPQLFNIVKGEMSFVGPRPELPELVEGFQGAYERLLNVRPGITSPASLYFRCEEDLVSSATDPVAFHKNILIPQKMALNALYIESGSVFYDFYLIVLTAISCISRRMLRGFDAKSLSYLQERFHNDAIRNVSVSRSRR